MSQATLPGISSIVASRKYLLPILIFATLLRAPLQEAQPNSIAQAHEPTVLELGQSITRELAGGQAHAYQISLEEGQYGRLLIEQRDIDIVIQLQRSDGKGLLSFNDVYASGDERVELVAEVTGNYRLSVQSLSKSVPAGHYAIRLAEIRAATENDRLLYEARKLELDSRRANSDGKYEESRRIAERALAIGEQVVGTDHPLVAALLHNLASYYNAKQDFGKAISLNERGAAIDEKLLGPEHPQTIRIRLSLAFLYHSVNEVAKADRLAEQALEVSQKTFGPEHPIVAACLLALGQITRDPKQREQSLLRSLSVCDKTGDTEVYFFGVLLNELGTFYTDKGDYQQAEQFLIRAQTLFEKIQAPSSMTTVLIFHNLGRIARERKDYAKAEEYYRNAIAIVEKAFGPENPRLAMIHNNLANIYRAKGEYAKSLEAHLRALRISEVTRGPFHPLTLLSLGNIAKTYAAQGSIAEAIKFQSRVDAVIERNLEMNLAIGSEQQKLSYLNSIAERTDRTISLNTSLAPNDPTASSLAALVLLQRKGRLLDATASSFASLHRKSTTEEQGLIEEYRNTTAQLARFVLNGPQTLRFEEHQKLVTDLEHRKDRLEKEISRRSAEFRAGSQPVTLGAVKALIPVNAALIEFAVYRPFDPKAESNNEAYAEPHYIGYVIRQTGDVQWRDLGPASSIDAAVAALRQTLRDPLRRDVRERARAVEDRVMRPILALIGNVDQLLISPDGALNLIPFEALVDEQDHYLVQNYSFTYLTSGRDLLRLQVSRQSKSNPVVIVDPLFGEPEVARAADVAPISEQQSGATGRDISSVYFSPLKGTAHEGQTIKSLFSESTLITGVEATEARLKQVTAPRLLHIATHGFFLDDSPISSASAGRRAISASVRVQNPLLRSGLALAGANLDKGGRDDGIFTGLEATALNLWGTKLVVLSACDTGVGEVKIGEGVYGLRRAFVLAGTETLVMSLWPVSDYVTRELITTYYRNLRQGLGRGQALRQVQLTLLRKKDRQHPFFWASFIQSGEWANLDEKR